MVLGRKSIECCWFTYSVIPSSFVFQHVKGDDEPRWLLVRIYSKSSSIKFLFAFHIRRSLKETDDIEYFVDWRD
jgi:hypothetical protein